MIECQKRNTNRDASNRWIALRLVMGQESSVIRADRSIKENATESGKIEGPEKQLAADYWD